MHFLGGHQWKSLPEIKPHLVTKTATRAGAGTVAFIGTILHYMPEQIEVLLHGCKLVRSCELRARSYELVGKLWIDRGYFLLLSYPRKLLTFFAFRLNYKIEAMNSFFCAIIEP